MIVQAKVMWPCLTKVNELSQKYQVDLVELDAATIKELEAAGVTVKIGKDKKAAYGKYVTAKATRVVPVVSADKAPFDAALLGNGSLVKASVKPFEYDFKGKKGISLGLQAVMVLEVKTYQPGGLSELVNEAPAEDNLGF